jgi:peptidoglycan/LPS O-acetylase OafA/YrhL
LSAVFGGRWTSLRNGRPRTDDSLIGTPRARHLDGIRGLAALGVLLFHCIYLTGYWGTLYRQSHAVGTFIANAANFCVCIFFALSGFLLFKEFLGRILFDEERAPTARYLVRRFLRIYPAYWAALLGFVVLIGAADLRGSVFGLVTLTERNLNRTEELPGIPVAWTLYIEVAFYAFLPIAAAVLTQLCRRKSAVTRVRIVVGSLIAMAAFSMLWIFLVDRFAEADLRLMLNLPAYLGWFSAGMVLAVILCCRDHGLVIAPRLTRLAEHSWWCWSVALLLNIGVERLGLLASSDQSAAQVQMRLAALAIAAFLVLLPLVMSSRPSKIHLFVGSTGIVWVGMMSYGVYIWHWSVAKKLVELLTIQGSLGGTLVLIALVLPISLLLGWISFRVIERPAMSLAPSWPTGSVESQRDH